MSRPSERFAAKQLLGQRSNQEDDFGILDGRLSASSELEHTLLVVADGMGGHVAGARASQLVTEFFIDSYQGNISDDLKQIRAGLSSALQLSNSELAKAGQQDPSLKGMGTTLLAAVVSAAGLQWLSVGDSPLWLYRQGKLIRVNADHSMVPVLAELVASGRLTEAEASVDPKRNALRSALMGDELKLIDIAEQPMSLYQGDRLLLASDGVLTLTEQQICEVIIINEHASNEDLAGAILDEVLKQNKTNQDNTTLLIYSIVTEHGVKEANVQEPITVIPVNNRRGQDKQ
ncbi:MAG: serine/threonine protein phosphatase [SAR86 cluster bacterium]|uniref:Serine/threonine protein phosphatase n=1 Tax=SAR86 cluster bacterium TaxID=2030880 RepID=A0A2A4MJE1_9GAMM|nr:MAG: serine/threonine protein phosphatase [SAR86 cluster bacterium]